MVHATGWELRRCGGCPAHLTRVRMLLDTVLCFDALTFVLGLLCAQCLRAMGRIKRGAVGMPKRKKMKRETVESGETVPSPPQEAVELAAAEPEVLVQRRPRREVPWALARRWTSKMKRQTKLHERMLKAFRKQEAGVGSSGGRCLPG